MNYSLYLAFRAPTNTSELAHSLTHSLTYLLNCIPGLPGGGRQRLSDIHVCGVVRLDRHSRIPDERTVRRRVETVAVNDVIASSCAG